MHIFLGRDVMNSRRSGPGAPNPLRPGTARRFCGELGGFGSASYAPPKDSPPHGPPGCRVARGGYPPPAPTEPYLCFSHTALRDDGL
jgi:hypothetical protein